MCVCVEDIFLGSRRARSVEEKAAERGNRDSPSVFALLAVVNPVSSMQAASHSHDPGYHGYMQYVMDPKDPHVTALVFILQ